MKIEKTTSIIELRALKQQFTGFKTKELELMKADYESREEDLKQVQIAIVLLGLLATYFSKTVLTGSLIASLILIFSVIFSITFVGILYSNKLRRTILQRKIIDLILKERSKP